MPEGLTEIPCIVWNEENQAKIKAFAVADNQTTIGGGWDDIKLSEVMQDIKLELPDIDFESFGFPDDELRELLGDDIPGGMDEDELDRYTSKIEAPIYRITGDEPLIPELYNDKRTHELIDKIESSNINEDIKDFLLLTAQRHTIFNYEKIAEFYAHQDREVQELMEDLTLIIIDFNKAIEQGFVDFAKKTLEGVRKNEG